MNQIQTTIDDRQDLISATEPDWSREKRERFWEPPKALLKSLRDYQKARSRGWRLRMRLAVLRHRLWSVVTGADIPLNCRISGGLRIPHPNGIVIHPDSTIGPNCQLFQQVTIGDAAGGVPSLGGHVDVGAGAKVIGRLTIGDHARVGANSVVTRDVPAGATVAGVPARLLRS